MTYRVLSQPLPLAPPPGFRAPEGFDAATTRAWQTAALKVRRLVERHPDQFPLYTQDGRWVVAGEAWTNWCEGFLGGQLWLLAAHTGEPWFWQQAEHCSRLIEHRKDDRSVHDLGFLFWPTWRRWHEATGDPTKNDVLVHAGRTLAKRFNEKGRFLRSFLAADSLFIDIMANVGLIFHAAAHTADTELARIAYEHCLTTRRFLVRGDGSTAHEGIFDLRTGAFLRQSTQQGWRDDGSWARGQAWAIVGFTTAYRYTGDRRLLSTACACADFYLDRTASALIPPNDWAEPAPSHRYESSAAAVAADGMWQLAATTPDENRARQYAGHSLRTLMRLCEPEFLSSDDPNWEGLLRHGIYHERKALGVDESVMWGDYFFLDALDQVQPAICGHPHSLPNPA